MRLTLAMDLDNAAFEVDHEDRRNGCEIARILTRLASACDGRDLEPQVSVLQDINGNTVGKVEIIAG